MHDRIFNAVTTQSHKNVDIERFPSSSTHFQTFTLVQARKSSQVVEISAVQVNGLSRNTQAQCNDFKAVMYTIESIVKNTYYAKKGGGRKQDNSHLWHMMPTQYTEAIQKPMCLNA